MPTRIVSSEPTSASSEAISVTICGVTMSSITATWLRFFVVLVRITIKRREQFRNLCMGRLRRRRRVVFLDERRGMSRRVHLLQRSDRHVRVNLRGLDVLVPEDLLDETDVGSVLVHVRRHAVPQEMAGSHLADLRGHDVTRTVHVR